MHLNYHGLAVSPDGERLATATPFTAINRLDLIEWRTGAGRAFVHADRRTALVQPTFSADGRQLAFVVAKPSRVGQLTNVSEIWIIDLRGNVVRRIVEDGRLFTNPVFSPDGRHLAYFRDVEHDAGPSAADADRRETREIVAMAAFEYDLEAATQTQLSSQPFGSPRGLHYAADPSRDLIFEVGPPLSAVEVNGEPRWSLTPEIVSAVGDQITAGLDGANVFRWKRGEPLPLSPPRLYGPDDGFAHPDFVRPTGDGLLVADIRTVSGADRTVVLRRSGSATEELFDLGERQLAQINVSADLSVAAAFNNRMDKGGEKDLQELVVASGGTVRALPYAQIQFSEPTTLQ